jgi:uncharacterized protein YcfL
MRTYLNLFLFLLVILFLLISCKSEDDNIKLIGYDIVLIDIIEPPEPPEIYSQYLIQPKVLVKNTGDIIVDSIEIAYYIWRDTMGIPESGPSTNWVNSINPGEEVVINLSKWDTINGNIPLEDGTYQLLVRLFPRLIPSDPSKSMERTFIIE